MKARFLLVPVALASVATLGGCAFLTPNWNALRPTNKPTPSVSASETPSPTPTQTTPVKLESVDITILNSDANAGGIDVIAQASNISEDGGSCTLTVSQAATKKTVTVRAESNVTDTQCFPLHLALTGFSSGPATFTVTYKSGAYQGTSVVSSVTIP